MNTLQISTSNAATESNSRLRYVLKTSMNLDSYVSLSKINLWYNWRNITQALGNNTLSYKQIGSGTTRRDIVLPDGSYAIRDINNYIHHRMEAFGDVDTSKSKATPDRYGINLYENATYNRVSIRLNGYEIVFGEGLAKTLGTLSKRTYTPNDNGNTGGVFSANFPTVPQIENVTSIQVHCNLVYNDYQMESSLLYSFTPKNSFGSLLSIEPRFPQWISTRKGATESVLEVWLTDQSGRLLLLEDHWGVALRVADRDLIRG